MRPQVAPELAQTAVRAVVSASVAAVILLSPTGCDDNDAPSGPSPTPTIDVELTPATLTLAPGQSGSVTVTVSRDGGWVGPVTLTVTGAPTYVGVRLNPLLIPAGASTSTLSCAVAASTSPATYELTVTASAAGVASQSATLAVTVTPETPTLPPWIEVALSSGTLAVAQGESGSVGITVWRHGDYAGPVALALADAPPGVAWAFDPPLVPSDAANCTLILTVEGTAAVGSYPLRIFASGYGVSTQWTPLTLIVQPAARPFISVRFVPPSDFVWTVRGDAWEWPGVTIGRHGGYAGVVHLSVEGLPPKVTASFDPPSLDPNTTTSAVTFSAAPDATLGEWLVTIRARGDGVADATTVVRLVVFPPA